MLSKFIASEYRDFDATRYVPLGDLLSYQIVLQSAVVCVRMAVEAIETIHTGKGSGPGDLGYVAAVSQALCPTLAISPEEDPVHAESDQLLVVVQYFVSIQLGHCPYCGSAELRHSC